MGEWVIGKLESNAKLNSKLRLNMKLKLELSLAICEQEKYGKHVLRLLTQPTVVRGRPKCMIILY